MRSGYCFFFFNDTATTEIYTRSIVGSVRLYKRQSINNPQNIVVAALDIFKILYQVLKIISSPLPIPFCMVSSEDEKKNMINIDSW